MVVIKTVDELALEYAQRQIDKVSESHKIVEAAAKKSQKSKDAGKSGGKKTAAEK